MHGSHPGKLSLTIFPPFLILCCSADVKLHTRIGIGLGGTRCHVRHYLSVSARTPCPAQLTQGMLGMPGVCGSCECVSGFYARVLADRGEHVGEAVLYAGLLVLKSPRGHGYGHTFMSRARNCQAFLGADCLSANLFDSNT